MNDLVTEGLLTLSQAAPLVPKYFPILNGSKHTLRYWAKNGLQGVSFEHIRIGQTIYTSEPAIERFRDRLWEVENPHLKPAKKSIAKRLKNAKRRLARAGA